MDITELLTFAVKNNASDVHLSAGVPPMLRIDGDLRQMEHPVLAHHEVINLVYAVMNERQRHEFTEHLETDFSFELANLSRFRVNMFNQNRGAAAVFRIIPSTIYSISDLGLPPIIAELSTFTHGLVLVTGASGSGKSTTLAAMIDSINTVRNAHILTIEDPVEFVHQSKKSLVHQREVHKHTHGFSAALRVALRADPDVILVGELRDLETIRLAITAAETGHLVLATLHTCSAAKTIHRIIDVFPAEEQSLVRSMLAESLQAVIAQTLLKKNGGGRVAALEIMIATAAIRNLIRENKTAQMFSSIQTGQAMGMNTLDQHLRELAGNHIISRYVARDAATDKSLF